ncbi:MAG: sensor histidine kinase, partial [Actinobacteria bacterium]|nr:sensor histidine kinase [Actinomycetota bacterium]
FERLWRGAASNGIAGSGVGLAIVAELVRANNGQVHATSELGGGATFTVLLPCAVPDA